jgi:ABC-2 type transport system ATP-binding protein
MTVTARLSGVTRSFQDVVAVADLDLELHAGRIYGLLGPNGAGKTTTLRTLLGLSTPDRGTVELLGGPPDDAPRARVGFVPEQRALPESGKVRELLVFFARMRGHDPKGAAQRADAWVERMELGEKAGERIKTLSNGQQQKVQIALAMMCDPDVVVLDEPLTGLDPTHQELVFRAVRDAAARGATVLLSTHRLREAQVILDHVFLLARGTKRVDQPLQEALEEAFDGTWRVRATGDTAWVHGPEVASVTPSGRDLLVRLQPDASPAGLLARAATAGGQLTAIEAVLPTLHDLYLRRVGESPDAEAPPGEPRREAS